MTYAFLCINKTQQQIEDLDLSLATAEMTPEEAMHRKNAAVMKRNPQFQMPKPTPEMLERMRERKKARDEAKQREADGGTADR